MSQFHTIWLQIKQIGIILAILGACTFTGYSVGYKAGFAKSDQEHTIAASRVTTSIHNENSNQSMYSSPHSESAINTTAYIPEDIIFLKPNTEPRLCPDTHPIKGVFSNDFGYFYTDSNQYYKRVKPDICFKSKDIAIEIAGFIQKF